MLHSVYTLKENQARGGIQSHRWIKLFQIRVRLIYQNTSSVDRNSQQDKDVS